MDYGFAPGSSGYDGLMRRLFTRRHNTSLISARKGRTTVRDFILHLDANSAIPKPIDNILLGSHANSQGYLFSAMFRGQKGPTSYEVLEDSITGTNTSIAIPDSLIGFAPGDPISSSFHIKGCNIGKATPFLSKMKESLGDNVFVTAPKHFHGIYYRSSHGTWELMAHEFRLIRKSAFSSRADYITALDAEGFTIYNGSPVNTSDWESWVPKKINKKTSVTVQWPLGVTLDRRKTIPFKREFRYKKDKYTFTIKYTGAVPNTLATRMTDLQNALTNHKYRPTDSVNAFDSSHPYPEYERWGYTSFNDFMNEHDWRFSKSGKRLVCTGYFHAYTLMIPITEKDPANLDNIIFNFYPKPGSALAHMTNFSESDTDFFAQV